VCPRDRRESPEATALSPLQAQPFGVVGIKNFFLRFSAHVDGICIAVIIESIRKSTATSVSAHRRECSDILFQYNIATVAVRLFIFVLCTLRVK
jgi:hypothetical protein